MGSIIEGTGYFRFPEADERVRGTGAGRGRAAGIARAAEPGDLLFVRTPGRLFSAGRAVTRNPYDHVAVVLEGGQTLNIVAPEARMLPLSRFTGPSRNTLLMRPAWRDPGQPRGSSRR